MKFGERFAELMNSQGIKIHKSVALGRWLHIDTNKCEDLKIRGVLLAMGCKDIKALKPGADGRHLDGSRHYRIVATF